MEILGAFSLLIGFLAIVVGICLFIIGFIRKNSKVKRNTGILVAGFAIFIFGIILLPKNSESNEASSAQKDTNKENSSEVAISSESSTSDSSAVNEELVKMLEESEAANKDLSTYRTDVTFENLARTPDNFQNEKIVLSGEVIQVMEDASETQLRLAVNENYDTIVLVKYGKSIVQERILENDIITIYGFSNGLISYESTIGGTITIPAVTAYIINR